MNKEEYKVTRQPLKIRVTQHKKHWKMKEKNEMEKNMGKRMLKWKGESRAEETRGEYRRTKRRNMKIESGKKRKEK